MEIYKYGSDILRVETQSIEKITDEIRDLLDDMIETMILAPGIGLAAPQVGHDLRMFVMNTNEDQFDKIINPTILEVDGVSTFNEGCLSFPELFADIARPDWIKVRYLNEDGEECELQRDGLWARCFQHELDHLNGRLLVDHLTQKQLRKMREELSQIENIGRQQNK
tara:strand:+ start:897 stop:1397 length:501 start_codon:yes stop_codon:yes gene_type:complete